MVRHGGLGKVKPKAPLVLPKLELFFSGSNFESLVGSELKFIFFSCKSKTHQNLNSRE